MEVDERSEEMENISNECVTGGVGTRSKYGKGERIDDLRVELFVA